MCISIHYWYLNIGSKFTEISSRWRPGARGRCVGVPCYKHFMNFLIIDASSWFTGDGLRSWPSELRSHTTTLVHTDLMATQGWKCGGRWSKCESLSCSVCTHNIQFQKIIVSSYQTRFVCVIALLSSLCISCCSFSFYEDNTEASVNS